jgi:hypothetical protein
MAYQKADHIEPLDMMRLWQIFRDLSKFNFIAET